MIIRDAYLLEEIHCSVHPGRNCAHPGMEVQVRAVVRIPFHPDGGPKYTRLCFKGQHYELMWTELDKYIPVDPEPYHDVTENEVNKVVQLWGF